MDQDDTDGQATSWLWKALMVVIAVVTLMVLVGLTTVLIKWGVIVLLVYAAFALGRHLLGPSSSQSSTAGLLADHDTQDDPLAVLEEDRDLDKLKARMNESPDSDY